MIPPAIYLIQRIPRVDGVPPTPNEVADLMIEFAKMHRKAILNEIYGEIDKELESRLNQLIEDIYPESNIK